MSEEEFVLNEAWKKRYTLRLHGTQILHKAEDLRKQSKEVLRKSAHIKTKRESKSPWKGKGLIKKELKSQSDFAHIIQSAIALEKEAKNVFESADEMWIEMVKRVYADIDIEWVKTKNEGKICKLGNGLIFSNAPLIKERKDFELKSLFRKGKKK